MEDTAHRAIAIVGSGAVLPDAPNVAAFWENIKTGRYSISEVTAGPLGPGALLRPRPQRAGQDLLQDRRLGARVPMGADEVATADPAARRRCHGRGPAMGDRLHPRSAGRLRLSQAAAGPRPHGRDPRQRHGRRKALPDRRLRVHFPEYAHELADSASFAALPAASARDITARTAQPHGQAICPRLPKTPCPANWPTASPAASPTSTTSTAPTIVSDAACASAMAAISAAVEGLVRARFRRGGHRRHRPQHGCADLREVLQDRCALGHRHAALCGGRRRLRHG